MPYKYIGRKTDFKGKTLWEIIGNLKNFGIDRIVGRNMFQRYPEPCYIKVVKVEALPNVKNLSYDEKRKVIALVERTFRGMKYPKFIQMESSTYKSDYFLIPKYQEEEFCKPIEAPKTKIVVSKMEFPPLLKEYVMRQMKSNVTSFAEEPKMKICYNLHGYQTYRVAEEGETPTEPEPSIGLGKPVTPRL